MRKEIKTKGARTANTGRIQGYHESNNGRYERSESYAFMGFGSNKLYTSDRFVKLDETFTRSDGKPMKAYGLEIETECNGITAENALAAVYTNIIFKEFPADLFKMQHDGSLGGRTSAECITQPMTKEFIRNSYPAFKVMYDSWFPAFQISAGGSSCGMHCNISNGLFGTTQKTQDEAIRKMGYILNKHFNLMCGLFCRDSSATMYCSRMHQFTDKNYAQTCDLSDFGSSHGVCYNLGHYNTGRIEIRLVGGQKTFAAFRNTMESVFHLVDAVKRISWSDCDDIVKIFSGCNEYVYDRLTKCRNERLIDSATVEKSKVPCRRRG